MDSISYTLRSYKIVGVESDVSWDYGMQGSREDKMYGLLLNLTFGVCGNLSCEEVDGVKLYR